MRILFIAPLPPPVHGSAMVSQYIRDSKLVNEQFDCDFVNLSTSRRMDEIGKGGAKKLLRFIGAYFAVFFKLLTHRYDLCYLAITCHGIGFLKDAPFVLLCKLFRRKVLIHQHNKGMNRCVDRWPYRWLLPLVYRNTTVMLLSWHLYEDISRVVKREQVVVCANGVPPLDNGLLLDETISHTEFTEDTEFSCNAENICQRADAKGASVATTRTLVLQRSAGNSPNTNSQTLHDASPVRLPDETFNLTQTTQTNISLQDDQRDEHANIDTIAQDSRRLNEDENENADARGASVATAEPLGSPRSTTLSSFCHPEGDSFAVTNTKTNTKTPSGVSTEGSQLTAHGSQPTDSKLSTLNTTLNAPRLLFLSNLIPSKGVYVLLDACQRLRERGLQFACDFVGGETKEISAEVFREAVATRGLEDHVIYHGSQYGEEKRRFFMNADVFVFPTFYNNECSPLVLMEAMQYRLPLVSTNEGGIPDLIVNGENGFVCERQDVSSLVVALERLITDSSLRQRMGERGYELYRERMTLEVFEERFTEILKSLVWPAG